MQGPDIKYLCSQTAWQITTQSSKSPIKSDFMFKHMAKIKKMRPSLDHLRYILEKVKWYTNKSAIFL